ncbi:adenylate/guanylate cyclase domain-containing protein [Rhizobium leucaenae]|uniref:histidine kinase n=1 Tax=Rhizobium leucaenae TaxID=29450 RepID=A0A7W6ZXW1_9HYPH|nr:adenylate/guanylate cyclase domain-containing protein [Rhizobium leucaenae]MBB4570772.1 class 3 adenylate cyclase/CheY-like chemotaxis protein [Rhizobium leucaenae]
MAPSRDIGHRMYIARIAQNIVDPAQAILGYQELITEEVREAGPSGALPDLERILSAARELNTLIKRLLDIETPDCGNAPSLDKLLRHDLRTPMNAILGYSEMLIEDFADTLPARLLEDVSKVIRESRNLLAQIDETLDGSAADADQELQLKVDGTIAADLARTMATRSSAVTERAGRILIVDDTASNRDLLSRRLRRDGHTVVAASSGDEALCIFDQQEFDLVLADVLMPDMNGIELLSQLKANRHFREIPVVMISGLKDDDAVARCIEAGAEDYLRKPINPVLLKARIAACLERRRWRTREKQYLAQIEFEKERANTLLHAVLPKQVVKRLADGEEVIADRIDMVTIVFADIVNFTEFAARTPAAALVRRLGDLFSRFDALADQYGIEKIKTIGDAYMAASGLPDSREDHAVAGVAFAKALLAEMSGGIADGPVLTLRIGIHSGPVIAGLIGRKRFVYDVWGHTVNVASRMESCGVPGQIQISQTTFDAIGEGRMPARRQSMNIRGIGRCTTYLLE